MLAPSAYEIGFIATVHEEKHILGMVEALDEALGELEW
jgi:glutamate-1-semialdehyde aminotransferase